VKPVVIDNQAQSTTKWLNNDSGWLNNLGKQISYKEKIRMSTYKQIFYQIVFSTKNRIPAITEENEQELYKYIWGITKAQKCLLYRINGMADHIHIFSDLHPTVCLSNYVKDIKVASSSWIKDKGYFPGFPGWQDGYGAFTYNLNDKARIVDYVKNQKEHHKTESFLDEYKRLLNENGIDFDEKYLL
jgi:putative transposase